VNAEDTDPGDAAGEPVGTLARLHETTRELLRATTAEGVAEPLVDAAVDVLGYDAVVAWGVAGDVGSGDRRSGERDATGERRVPGDSTAGDATDDRDATDGAGAGAGGDPVLVPLAATVDVDARGESGADAGGDSRADPSAHTGGASGNGTRRYGRDSRLWELYRDGEPVTVEDAWLGTEVVLLVPLGDHGLLGLGGPVDRSDDRDAELVRLLAADAEVALEAVAREGTLREERDQLATLFEHTTDAIAQVEFEGPTPVVSRVNEAFERTFGYEESEVVGTDLDELVAPDNRLAEARELSGAARRAEDIEREVTRLTADGPREFRLHGVSFERDDGSVTGYAVYTDVTERARYVRTLTRLHETARELMRVEGRDAVAEVAARSVREILGYPVNAVRFYDARRDALVLVAATDETFDVMGERPTYQRGDGVVWSVYETGEHRVVEDVEALDDGVDRPGIRSSMYLPLGGHGTLSLGSTDPHGFDETDVRLGQVLAATVEVALDRADRTQVLRRRERELERQNERLTEFASVVSHDLRNPLSVAQGYAELARQAVASGDVDDALAQFDRVERAHERMDALITDLLTLAREGQRVGETEVVALGEAARDSWAAVDTRSATLEVVDDRELAADPDRLASLLENLFRNAVEHGGPDVRVTVAGTADGFAVADDGPGIPPEDRDRVFERGYSTGDHGTGFGLSIARGIAEAHGWSIRATGSDAGGARFEVTGVDREATT